MTDKLLLEYIKIVERSIILDKELLKQDQRSLARLKKAAKKLEASDK